MKKIIKTSDTPSFDAHLDAMNLINKIYDRYEKGDNTVYIFDELTYDEQTHIDQF